MGLFDIYKKWKNYKTYMQLKKLWNEYKKSIGEQDSQQLEKLNNFLDNCKNSLKQIVENENNQQKIEDIIGDVEDLVQLLLNYLKVDQLDTNNQNEMVDEIGLKALEVISVLIREKKYKKQLDSSQFMLNEMVNLLDKVNKNESKILLVKLIIMISEQNANKQIFLKSEGFRKLLILLMKKDQKLQLIVSKALVHFLNIDEKQIEGNYASEIMQNIENDSIDIEQVDSMSDKFKRIMQDITRLTMDNIKDSFKTKKQSIIIEDSCQQSQSQQLKKEEDLELFDLNSLELYQQYNLIFELDFYMLLKITNKEKKMNKKNSYELDELNLSGISSDQNENVVVQIDEIGFQSILDTLNEKNYHEDQAIKVELLNAIQKLLQKNKMNRKYFRDMKGYQQLFFVFNDGNNQNTVFGQLKQILVDNKNQIKNYDAVQLILFELINKSTNQSVLENCLQIVLELIQENTRNMFILKRLGLIDNLTLLLVKTNQLQEIVQRSIVNNECLLFNLDVLLKKNEQNLDSMESKDINQLVQSIFRMISQFNGVYDIKIEIYLAEIVLGLLVGKDTKNTQIMDTLLQFLKLKLQKKCQLIIVMDYEYEYFMNIMYQIFKILSIYYFEQPTQNNPYLVQFEKLIMICNNILECSHQNDVIQQNAKTNTLAQYLINQKKQDSDENNENVKQYKQKIDILKKLQKDKFTCKNICYELKYQIISKLKSIVKEFQDLSVAFNFLKMNPLNSSLNLSFLRLLKCFLKNDQQFLEVLNQNGGPLVLNHLILQIYQQDQEKNLICIFNMILELCCSKYQNNGDQSLNSRVILEPQNSFYLQCFQDIMFHIQLSDSHSIVIDGIYNLIQNKNNFNLVKQYFGFQQIIDLILFKLEYNENNIYINMMTLLEYYFNVLSGEEIEQFFESFLNSQTKSKVQKYQHVLLDVLSVLGQHLLFRTNSLILDKIIQNELYMNFIGFLDSQDCQLQQICFKMYCLIYLVALQQKKKEQIILRLRNLFQLIKKILLENENTSKQLCQSILVLVNFDIKNINFFLDQNGSVIMNRSQCLADKIVQHEQQQIDRNKEQKEKEKEQTVFSIEILEILLVYLERIIKDKKNGDCEVQENDYFGFQILKSIYDMLDQSQVLQKLYESQFINKLQYLFNKLDSNQQKSKQQLREICVKLIDLDLKKSQAKKIKSVEMLKKIFNDREFIIEMIRSFLEYLYENPNINLEHQNINSQYLKNLLFLFQQIEELVNVNGELMLLMIEVINELASKNSGDVRKIMMDSNFFDFKDQLLIQTLKYQIKQSKLIKILEGFNFKELVQNSGFKKNNCYFYLLKLFFDNSGDHGLQTLILNIFRQDLNGEMELCKKISNILENKYLFLYLFDYSQISIKCIDCQQNADSDYDEGMNESILEMKRINKQMDLGQFIELVNRNEFIYVKKQILLRIDNEIIMVQNTNQQKIKQNEQKIGERYKKMQKQSEENLAIEQAIIKDQLKCSKQISKQQENFVKQYKDRKKMNSQRISSGNDIVFCIENSLNLNSFDIKQI